MALIATSVGMRTRLIGGATPPPPLPLVYLTSSELRKPLQAHLQSLEKFYLLKLRQSSGQEATEAGASLSSW